MKVEWGIIPRRSLCMWMWGPYGSGHMGAYVHGGLGLMFMLAPEFELSASKGHPDIV